MEEHGTGNRTLNTFHRGNDWGTEDLRATGGAGVLSLRTSPLGGRGLSIDAFLPGSHIPPNRHLPSLVRLMNLRDESRVWTVQEVSMAENAVEYTSPVQSFLLVVLVTGKNATQSRTIPSLPCGVVAKQTPEYRGEPSNSFGSRFSKHNCSTNRASICYATFCTLLPSAQSVPINRAVDTVATLTQPRGQLRVLGQFFRGTSFK